MSVRAVFLTGRTLFMSEGARFMPEGKRGSGTREAAFESSSREVLIP